MNKCSWTAEANCLSFSFFFIYLNEWVQQSNDVILEFAGISGVFADNDEIP